MRSYCTCLWSLIVVAYSVFSFSSFCRCSRLSSLVHSKISVDVYRDDTDRQQSLKSAVSLDFNGQQ